MELINNIVIMLNSVHPVVAIMLIGAILVIGFELGKFAFRLVIFLLCLLIWLVCQPLVLIVNFFQWAFQ